MPRSLTIIALAALPFACGCTHLETARAKSAVGASDMHEFAPVRLEFSNGSSLPKTSDYEATIGRDGKAFVRWRNGEGAEACYRGKLPVDDVFPVFSEIETLDPLNAERLPAREAAKDEGGTSLGIHNASGKCLQVALLDNDEHTTAWGNNVIQRVEWLVVKLTTKANEIDCKAAPPKPAKGSSCAELGAPALAGTFVNHY